MEVVVNKIFKFINQKLALLNNKNNNKVRSILPNKIQIGKYIVIEKKVDIDETLKSIGDGTYICRGTSIYNCKEIGKYCSIARGVSIGVGSHPINWLTTSPLFYSSTRKLVDRTSYNYKNFNSPVIIESDVWIGTNAIILSGVKIGVGSIIAAGAIVTKDVEPYSIVAGVPAVRIKSRFEQNTVNDLIKYNVANLTINEIVENLDEIQKPLEFIKNMVR